MTRAARKEDGRVDILAAAARIAAARGYHGLSMRELARAAGMSLANLYNYFPSKEDLLFVLQSRAFETLVGLAEGLERAPDPPDARLHAFILTHVRYVAEHPDVMRVLVGEAGELPPARRRTIRGLKERYFEIGARLVRDVAGGSGRRARRGDTVEIERATYCMFGMLNWVYAWYEPERHGGPQDVARTIHRIALGGLGVPLPDRGAAGALERLGRRVEVRSPIRRPVPPPAPEGA